MEQAHEIAFGAERIHLWQAGASDAPAILFVHGATFPSGLSVAHRLDGFSWRDDLIGRGFQVWGFDFVGFGRSSRPAAMAAPAADHPSLGRAAEAACQVAAVLDAMRGAVRGEVGVIAHSWGGIAAARLAAQGRIGRLALFGPIVRRAGPRVVLPAAAWRDVTLAEQQRRFVEDLPAGEAPVLAPRHFAQWAADYLASDPMRPAGPDAVRVPAGPRADILSLWAGEALYDPAAVRCPVLIARGAWDSLTTDADAGHLYRALGAARKWDVKIARATHLAHLEAGRFELYAAVAAFLEL